MVDESKLSSLTYDENGNLSYRLAEDSNIACTDSGLAYTGIVRPRLADGDTAAVLDCSPRTDCDCGPIVRDVAGDIWIPPVACYDAGVVTAVSGNPDLTLPPGGFWTSPIETSTIDAFGDCDTVYAIYNVYYQIVLTDSPQEDNLIIVANSSALTTNCWQGVSDTIVTGGPDVFRMSGQYSEAFQIEPGDSATFDFAFSVNSSAAATSDFGVFEYRIRIMRHVWRNFDVCETQPLGGSAL